MAKTPTPVPTISLATPPLAISLFGAFGIKIGDQPLTAFRSNKARALLAYLALTRPHPIARTTLADLLWKEYAATSARVNLRQVLTHVRELLAPTNLLSVTHQHIGLAVESPAFWCDATAFAQIIETCQHHPHSSIQACTHCQTQLRQAATLYEGVFLENFPAIDSSAFTAWRQAQSIYFAALFATVQAALQYQTQPRSNLLAPSPALSTRTTELTYLVPKLMHPVYRWLTLVGPAGVGKTQLALALGEYVQRHFTDGVWFVEFRPPSPPITASNATMAKAVWHEYIATAISRALGWGGQGTTQTKQQLCAYVNKKEMLLILDRFDLLGDGADFIVQLLQSSPRLRVLVTARTRPHLQSQLLYRVEPQSVTKDRMADTTRIAAADVADRIISSS